MHRRLIPALVLIALGSLFLLDNLGERIRVRYKQVVQGEHIAIALG